MQRWCSCIENSGGTVNSKNSGVISPIGKTLFRSNIWLAYILDIFWMPPASCFYRKSWVWCSYLKTISDETTLCYLIRFFFMCNIFRSYKSLIVDLLSHSLKIFYKALLSQRHRRVFCAEASSRRTSRGAQPSPASPNPLSTHRQSNGEWVLGHFADRHFADRHFADRYFADRHFANRTYCWQTFCRQEISSAGYFSDRRFTESVLWTVCRQTFCRHT